MTTVSVFGGTGFLGRQIVQRLAAEGATVRIAVRSPDRAHTAPRAAEMERVTVVRIDVLCVPSQMANKRARVIAVSSRELLSRHA